MRAESVSSLNAALADRYRLERELGVGAMATVHLAEDLKHHRKVAIKVLRPELAAVLGPDRFLREVQVTASLQHPHIVPLYDSGHGDSCLYFVTPYVEGGSLRDRLNRDTQLPLEDALRIIGQVASALDFAHRNGVIHRDIKPENILLHDGDAIVADFGIALAVRAAGVERLTQTGLSLGTPSYMSPEQVAGDRDLDARSDVYSLACVLYEMLAGTPPFVAATVRAVMARQVTDPAPPVTTVRPGVPASVANAIAKALSKAPADRFASAKVFAQALSAEEDTARVEAKSIVVLPFANVSPDPDTQYFADGLTEELITDLSHVAALRVISRTSAMRLKGCGKDAPTLARELGVRYVLDGSVRKAGQSIRITAQLVDAAADAPLWAEKFSGSDEDVFELQERMSRQIVEALRITLTPAESGRIAHRPIGDPRAYDCFLRARHKILRFSARDLDDALALLGEGLKILGENELLLGAMGQVYLYYVHWGVRPDTRYLDEAERCAQALFRLNPDSAQGHAVLGGLHMKRAELQNAVRHLKRAVRADPEHLDALTWLLYCYLTAGKPAAARPIIEYLLDVDPLTAITHAGRGWLLLSEGRIPEALPHYERGYQLDPASPLMRWLHAWSLAQSGRRSDAARELAVLAEEAVGTVFGALAGALSHALGSDGVAARAAVSPLLVAAAQCDEGLSQFLSEIFALVGDHDEAARWLECAVQRGYLNYPILAEIDTLYGRFREDPRFARIMADVRHRWEAFEV
jgi:serine/threonine protein kinase/tetratricopeptide (TPR) repeat protein